MNKKMELGNPAFYAGLRALAMSVEYSLSTIIFEQKIERRRNAALTKT